MARRLLAYGGTIAAALALLASAPASAHTGPVDPEFDDSPLITGLDRPTAVRFAPDGRIFVAEKGGVVKAFDQPLDPTPTTVVDLRKEVHDFWDRGLLGMALDPQFGEPGGSKRRIWLLYARDGDAAHPPPRWGDQCPAPPDGPGATKSGCVITGRLVYVTLGANGVAGEPVPVIENEWCAQFPSHTVGTVAFGPDGMLYAGAGEGASFAATDWGQFGGQGGVPLNPCGDLNAGGNDPRSEGGALRAQDARTPEDPQTLAGTIIRVDPLTGDPAAGNPHASSTDPNRRRVIAYGLRNPFRFAFRPGSRELWVGDVGSFRQEEINRVDTDDADAENLGWPCFEGAARAAQYMAWDLCASLPASDVTAPVFSYAHGSEAVPGDGCGTGSEGSSISGIAFHGDSHYPAAYDGALFFADYARGCIWSMRPGADGRPDPATGAVFAHAAAVDLQIGPEGELVYASIDGGEIRRIRYRAPRAVVTADQQSVGSGKPVRFSAAGSFDPAGSALTYAWDLDSDGAFDDGTAPEVAHVYQQLGRKTARLRVTGTGGRTAVAATVVDVGSDPPTNVRIEPRAPLRPWMVGDRLEFDGAADDADPDELTLTWTLTIRHCETSGGCHSHQVEQRTGPSASFTAPDHEWPAHLLVRLEARNKYGLTAERTLRLDPATVTVRAEASPRGPAVGLNQVVGPTPPAQTLIAGSNAVLSVISPQAVDGRTYRFVGWSDGSTEWRRTVAVPADAIYVARFEQVGPPGADTGPLDTTRPSLRVLWHRLRLARGRLAVRVLCPREACTVRVRIRGRRSVTRTLAAGRAATVRLRLPARVRGALRAGRRVTVRLELSATDDAGNRRRLARAARLAGARTRAP